jgi:hypothetical protein
MGKDRLMGWMLIWLFGCMVASDYGFNDVIE